MILLHAVIVFLHVVTAAAWFGLSLGLAAQSRQIAGYMEDNNEVASRALLLDGAHGVKLMGWSLLSTFVLSMLLLFLGGGYVGQPEYHAASALILVLLGVQYLIIGPTWKRLSDTSSATRGLAKRLSMGIGLGHLLWLILLGLMFWNRFIPAL